MVGVKPSEVEPDRTPLFFAFFFLLSKPLMVPGSWLKRRLRSSRSAGATSSLRYVQAALLAHGFAAQFQTVGVVHEAVADRVGESLVTDEGVPVLGVKLAGHDRRVVAVAILEDFSETRLSSSRSSSSFLSH